jgi:hypothetical protein
MNFKEATDGLCEGVSHADLAQALGVSVASVRQARLAPLAKAHREPPRGWRYVVISLAEQRIMHYRRLIDQLRKDADE